MIPAEHVREQALAAQAGVRELERRERGRVERVPERRERLPGGQGGGDRGEHVAPVEGRRHGLEAGGRTPDVDGLLDPSEPLPGQRQQAVVRPHQHPLLAREAQGDGPPGAPHARIDDREMDPLGHIGQSRREHQRARADVVAGDRVGDVDHARLGTAARDHAVADADELVVVAVVRQEGDRGWHPLQQASRGPPVLPGAALRVGQERGQQPVDVVSRGLEVDPQAGLAQARARDRADRDDPRGPAGSSAPADASSSAPAEASRLRTVEEDVNVM